VTFAPVTQITKKKHNKMRRKKQNEEKKHNTMRNDRYTETNIISPLSTIV